MANKNMHTSKRNRNSLLFWTLIAIIPILWLAYLAIALSTHAAPWIPEWLRLPAGRGDVEIFALRGQLGDTFGVFNALVSTLALVGLIFTIRTQQQQLASQESQSLDAQRLMRQQQFQEQLFQGIEAYRSLLTDITGDGGSHARNALEQMRRETILRMPAASCEQLGTAVEAQKAAFNKDLTRYRQRDIERAIEDLERWIEAEPGRLELARTWIGEAWSGVYQENRFQLDALFRAWYTVYRILETAKKYEIEDFVIRLYSATFRAQLSWIEMAMLIVNQSGRASDEAYPAYPNACRYSNDFAVFENLDSKQDIIVTILKKVARNAPEAREPNEIVLTKRALGEA
jgi:hypothetical protein